MYKITILGNGTEWCYYCWKNYLDKHPEETVFYKYSFPIAHINASIYRFLFKIYYPNGKRMAIRSFVRILIQLFFRLKKKYNNIVVVYDWNELATDKAFMAKLKKKNPRLLIVYVFTNIVKYTGATEWGILNDLNSYYDAVFAFDKVDAIKYNFKYLPLIYAKEDCVDSGNTINDIDIFYVGKSKDRLDIIHKVFKKAKSEGLRCDFNIINVPEELQLYKNEIKYNRELPYCDVINKIKRSRCLLDVIQGESTGLTIKVVESVVYGKKLITTNPNVLVELKSDPQNVLLYSEDVKLRDFVLSGEAKYSKLDMDYFSPDLFVEQLKKLFNSKMLR